MKAAQFVGKSSFEIKEVENPTCPEDGVIVRVDSAAICGTDLKIMKCQDTKLEKGKVASMKIPRITGHEFSGIIEEAGNNVNGFNIGDRVIVAPTIPCLNCAMCYKGYHEMCLNLQVVGYHRDGGFAELVRVDNDMIKAGCLVSVPDNVSMEAAALTEPLSCAINCLELSSVDEGDTVLVMGAGPLGLIISDLARHFGSAKVFIADISEKQLEKTGVSAIDKAINLSKTDIEEEINQLTNGQGVDLVVTACSAPQAQQAALKVVSKRGKINFFGGLPRDRSVVELDTNLIHYKEIMVIGTHGSAPRHIAKAVELLAEGKMDMSKYIERIFPLNKINEALKTAHGEGRLKILIKP